MAITAIISPPILLHATKSILKFDDYHTHLITHHQFNKTRKPSYTKFSSKQSPVHKTANSSSSSSSSLSVVAQTNEPMIPPYNVLITGSTKGIGYALAKEFLKAGDNVVICSRSVERVKAALESLKVESGKQHVVPHVMLERGMTSKT